MSSTAFQRSSVHAPERLVARDAGVVDDDVDAAVLARAGASTIASGASARGDVAARARSRRAPSVTASRSSASAGTSSPTTCAPSRASVAAIAAPMPREAPVTSATLPSSGRSQSSSGGPLARRPDPHDLAGHVGRARREQEAQRRVELLLGAGRDVDELRRSRRARTSLPSERVKPSSARCAVASRGLAQRSGGVPSTTIRPQRLEHGASSGEKNARSSASCGAVGDPGRVEDERLEALLVGAPASRQRRRARVGGGRAQVVAQLVATSTPRASTRASADEPAARARRRAARGPSTTGSPGLVALERRPAAGSPTFAARRACRAGC